LTKENDRAMTTPQQQPPQAEILSPGPVAPLPATFQAPAPAKSAAPPATEQLASVAASALEAETRPATAPIAVVVVQHEGQTYSVPASRDDWPMTAVEALDDGKVTYALRAVLGEKQWKRFKKTQPTVKVMGGLFDGIAKACGFEDTGE
jgi:hypothetical protein